MEYTLFAKELIVIFSKKIKDLIAEVILLCSQEVITESIIDQGVEKLNQAKELLQQEPIKEMYYYNFRNTLNNRAKINTVSNNIDDNNITISNLKYTSGNVKGYSGWTDRGLQLSSNNVLSMDYINSPSVEINVNTLNWNLRNKIFILALLGEDGTEYLIDSFCWGYMTCYIKLKNDYSNVTSGQLTNPNIFEYFSDEFHSITLNFVGTSIDCYVDGVFAKSFNHKLQNIVGVKLYNDTKLYSDCPYESIIFYKEQQSGEDIKNNYAQFVKRISTTGYEKMPISEQREFSTLNEMLEANLPEGSIVTTNCYSTINDNGGAKYKIITYNAFYEELPLDCKYVQINGQVKTNVDNYGNHKLKNGLVAKLISDDNTYTPEQWGAKGDGITSDTEAFICMLALTKTGTINLNDGAIYMINSRSEDECSKYVDNRYLKSMINVFVGGCHRPLIANCNNLVIDGNPKGDGNYATLKIKDDDFGFGMGMLNLGGRIEGCEIKHIIFNSNGLSMSAATNKLSNHTIVYSPSNVSENGILNDLNIHHNKFLANGTKVDLSDAGGDHILIINPTSSKNVWIEDNEFYDWGRWVYSVDLGGSGERFYNYKFNRNKCIQSEENVTLTGKYRGLGWIDFEARKCFTDLEMIGNTVEGLIGFAMNGNGKVLENFTFNNNNIKYIARGYRSAYQYFINFYHVSSVKNFICENNNINSPYGISPSGSAVDGVQFRNNKLSGGGVLFLNGLHGDIIIENNERVDKGCLLMINSSLNLPSYVDEYNCNFVFENNHGGIMGENRQDARFFKLNNPRAYKNFKVSIKNNVFDSIDVSAFYTSEFTFDTSQMKDKNESFRVRGAKFINTTGFNSVNVPIQGGATYKKGDLMVENLKMGRTELSKKAYPEIDGKLYNVYCEDEGYFPVGYKDVYLTLNANLVAGTFYFTDDNLYICTMSGKTPETGELPTSTEEGVDFEFGTAKLLWCAKRGKIRLEEIK